MPDYHIHTIPLWEAYRKEGECPLCDLESTLEQQYLDAALGGGMMQSDLRQETNTLGFCAGHLRALQGMQSALPLALTLHTHLLDVIAGLEQPLDALDAAIAQEEGLPAPKRALRTLTRGGDITASVQALAQSASSRTSTCAICRKIDANMHRYLEALLYMWKQETEFRQAFAASKGLCMAHFPLLANAAAKHMAGAQRREFLGTLSTLQRENLRRIEQDLLWFTQKFDYRNQDKPWGNSQDALPRTVQKLRGRPPGGSDSPSK